MTRIIPFAGFERNLEIENDRVSMIVTLEVGPRILSFGPKRGPNLLAVYSTDEGLKDDDEYHSYGGHRLWAAPEHEEETYTPESDAPEYREEGGVSIFSRPPNAFGLGKELAIVPKKQGTFVLRHTLRNASEKPLLAAPWAITVMAPGGEALIPQSDFIPHSDRLLPVRPIVLWGYSKMADSRFTWGDQAIRMRQSSKLGPLKFGSFVDQGIAAYSLDGNLFVKRFPARSDAIHPDLGCNFEAFTNERMLEVESLGTLITMEPGSSVDHLETWYLLEGESPPTTDAELGEWFRHLSARCPHLEESGS